jgi:hypothetical protein
VWARRDRRFRAAVVVERAEQAQLHRLLRVLLAVAATGHGVMLNRCAGGPPAGAL